MKSLFPNVRKNVELVSLTEGESLNDVKADVYMWTAADGTTLAAHMIMPCPNCSYPISLAVGEFDFESKTLRHLVKCPARWKKLSGETSVSGMKLLELNDKGRPVVIRCSWTGFIEKGRIIEK